MAATQRAGVYEIFSGIQGEGMLVGVRQVFVRFAGCHVACRYCDTTAAREQSPDFCRVEEDAGSRRTAEVPNALTVDDVLAAVLRLQEDYPHHSVSLTGGEPLLHPAFISSLIRRLRRAGLRSYLETNGLLPEALAALTSLPDYLAADIKLPSTAGIGERWEAHTEFLRIAVQRLGTTAPRRLQVKVVFCEGSLDDVSQAAALTAGIRADLPFILQPVTPHSLGPEAPTPATVLEAQYRAARYLADVRVIPQTHVLLGQW